MARKKHEDEGISNEWLNTYADMVTLLLTFFVMLYSMSTVDADKFTFLASALSNIGINTEQLVVTPDLKKDATGKVGNTGSGIGDSDIANASQEPINLETLYDMLKNYVDTQTEGEIKESIDVQKGKHYVFIRFTDNVFFNADSAVLRNEGKVVLDNIGEGIKNAEASIGTIRIEGHTAAIPENENYHVDDRQLSSDRANEVLKYLEKNCKIQSELLSSLGYGKYRPIADNNTPEGRKQNRRVEILVVDKNIDVDDKDSLKELVAKFFGEDKFKLEDNYIP
ncbi:OmpA/MotB family protein [Acetanaerobacterium elongatum]|uniref:Chemotaxis protein MotB n=1 Tax=Acetanaerobacterium elongatum TaxID=258515 RepID=A0A1G9ZFZ4_9FIRM|nr:flagellar motor protein MotB [Acetanaerobacterium elongatum]SDN20017.1 chemotaxis protein MotB [Acetanaerobacterium elongatum]